MIVPTHNVEETLSACLESVEWADDIFVVDSFSTDKTLDIAKKYTDHIVQHEYVNSATQKNWAIPQVTTAWVMIVDADERVTPGLRNRVLQSIAEPGGCNGFSIRRMTYFFGKLIKHCGWQKDYLMRLFRRDCGRYEDLAVHADVVIDGEVGKIHECLLHDTYRDFDDYLEKFHRYTTLSAADLYRQGKPASLFRLILRPIWRFIRMYLLQGGILDGKHGLVLCVLGAMGVFTKYAKLWEMRRRGEIGKLPQGRQR